MGNIRVLDDHIANQIAAGEVVERPSSVVKELVENAIDAGSTAIDVAIEEGGLQLIRVADNGSGIGEEDVKTAFFRHATSKISSGKDLFQIRTLGFRGEALPSIAAVAKVECVTSALTTGLGRRLIVEGGTVRQFEEATAPRGTTILVRELFYNTPARLKYMKTIQTELGHVSDYLHRLALAHPGVAFTLRHNGHTLLRTTGNGDLLQVVAAVYGTAIAKQMIPVAGESPDYTIGGFVSKPELNRSGRAAISTVINGRYIRNYGLTQALLDAYHTLLPVHRFPVAALHIRMDPALVDVNVHPSKLEVRFSKEAELTQLLSQTVKEALRGQVLIPSAAAAAAKRPAMVQEQMELYRPGAGASAAQAEAAAAAETAAAAEPQLASGAEAGSRVAGSPAQTPPVGAAWGGGVPAVRRPAEPAEPGVQGTGRPPQPAPPAPGSAQPRAGSPEGRHRAADKSLPAGQWAEALLPAGDEQQAALPAFPRLHPVGQVHGTYIVAQNEEGLFLIDQHAAHERINYERFYELFGNPQHSSQQLLVPITLDFTPTEAQRLADKLPLFEQVGVYLEPFGGHSFIVRAYPHWFPAGEEKRIIEEMADWVLGEKKAIDLAKLREKSSILCSCKASIKANQSLQVVEMEALLDRLGACRNPYTCPHGRPIVISFSTYELEKMFKRVM